MEDDRLNEKRAQEILDRLDKDDFVFTMNDLEGEEYVTLPNGTKMLCDIMNDKIDGNLTKKIKDEKSKPIDDQILQFDDYINTYDMDHKDDNNLLFKIDDTEGDEAFDETEKYYGSDEEGLAIKLTNDKNESVPLSSTTTKPITIQSNRPQISASSLSVSDDGHLVANSPNIPVTPPPSLAKSQNMFKIFKSKDEIYQSDRSSHPVPDGELNEKDIQELLAKLVIHQDKQK
ncbi:hypothetical protein BCR32DRAFT_266255 [Anaeromyces robustus]|jgi:hypothetical protein|uniref:Uncharacterized protein n=1 Tax=Anaeromyces robustus TaxID=1754192 RepID=A0A1Y1XGP8_9FUNG|nr:hypothetical protein BCR32DRAFT_266255 [Anaeromyces robustus]|eukprot:ORX84554.1 hypothetical protein BCR32DRAFT_266255 [Anaeromyces robustus]